MRSAITNRGGFAGSEHDSVLNQTGKVPENSCFWQPKAPLNITGRRCAKPLEIIQNLAFYCIVMAVPCWATFVIRFVGAKICIRRFHISVTFSFGFPHQ